MTPLGEAEGQAIVEPPVREAAARFAAGDADAALGLISPLVTGAEPSLSARFLLAMMAWKMGRLDAALDLVRECHAHDPMDGTVAEALASLYAQCGNAVESIYAAKLATALGGHGALAVLVPEGFPPFESAYAAINEQPQRALAQRDLTVGRLGTALEHARQHVAIEGADPDGHALYATLLLRAGRACDAVDEMRAITDEAERSAPLASLYARCLAASGEAAAALRWHGEAQALAPQDAALAAARIADGPWLDEPDALARMGAAWAQQFCPPRQARAGRPADQRRTIAYLVNALGDRGDAGCVAEVARAHDRSRFTVIGYGAGAQSWDENAALSGAFDRWRDIAALDAATIARYFMHDAVDAVIDAAGFQAPQSLLALARLTAIRVSWLGNPAALRGPVYDARIAAADDGEANGLWRIAGGFPVPLLQKPVTRGRAAPVQFGADATLAQLSDETVALWAAILRSSAEAKLLLRAKDTRPGTVDRLVARFGAELAARIDLVSAERFEDFYALVDVALAPRRGSSPRMAAEAVACRVPVVAFAASSPIEPYGAFVRGSGLGGASAAANAGDYVRRALALAAAAEPPPAPAGSTGPAAFAQALEQHVLRALEAGAGA